MKISDTKGLPAQFDKQETKATKGAPAAVESDSVRLSGLPAQLADMSSSLAAEPHFDADRVEAIKAAISEGRLQINPEAIADKLLASARELLGPAH
jgi:negative regulator of flagellin synthesis FlgM